MFKEILDIMTARGYQFRDSIREYNTNNFSKLSFIKADSPLNCIVYIGHNLIGNVIYEFELFINIYPSDITITTNKYILK